MKRMKRAAALALAAVMCVCLLSACAEENNASGLELSVALGEPTVTLDPIRATAADDMTVLGHLYENLMKIAADNSGGTTVASGMAKSYDVKENKDGTITYTFQLRNAKWSDGTAVKAADFVYAWRRLADPVTKSPNAQLLSAVKGYDEVRSTGDTAQLAVEAKNDSTLLVTLSGVCEWFLTDACTSPAAVPLREDVVQRLKEEAAQTNRAIENGGGQASATWASDYTKLVTNGPYTVESFDANGLRLQRSESYTGAVSSGPDAINIHYVADEELAWTLYQEETVDFVARLPEQQLAQLAENESWTAIPELATYTVLFNTKAEPFNDPLVRQAFSLAIDRAAIAQLAGAAASPATGLVPPGVPDTEAEDFRTHGGDLTGCDPEKYEDRCLQAQTVLEESGYGGTYHAATVEYLYVDEGGNALVAQTLAQMWQTVLRIHVRPVAVSEAELKTALQSGNYAMAATSITGYANDAESFLERWESGNGGNTVGYYNSAFNTLLAVINSAGEEMARRGCLHDAESLLLEDYPLTPLYFSGTDFELRTGLTGVCRDARGFFSFATVAKIEP